MPKSRQNVKVCCENFNKTKRDRQTRDQQKSIAHASSIDSNKLSKKTIDIILSALMISMMDGDLSSFLASRNISDRAKQEIREILTGYHAMRGEV